MVISQCFRALPKGRSCSDGLQGLQTQLHILLQLDDAISVISFIVTQLARTATRTARTTRIIMFRLKCCLLLLMYSATKN